MRRWRGLASVGWGRKRRANEPLCWVWLAVVVGMLGTHPATLRAQDGAQPGKPGATESRLEKIERENAELRSRVQALEEQRGADPAGADSRVADRGGEAEPSLRKDPHGISIHSGPIAGIFQFFGDAGFEYDNPRPHDASSSSFVVGSFDLFTAVKIGERFNALAESVFEADSAENKIGLELERLWASWTMNDLLYVKLGREHSPLSRWDRKLHHGRFLWLAATQPYLARFEEHDAILPIHAVGLELGGSAFSRLGTIEYVAGVFNGRGETPEDVQDVADRNNEKAVEVTLSFAPYFAAPLVTGASFYADEIPAIPGDLVRTRNVRELISMAFVDYERGPFQLLAEGGVILHKDRDLDRHFDHHAGYVQAGYSIARVTPYVRFDWRSMAQGDSFFAPADRDLDRWEQLLGVQYRINEFAKVNVEGGLGRGQQRHASGEVERRSLSRLTVSLSWAF